MDSGAEEFTCWAVVQIRDNKTDGYRENFARCRNAERQPGPKLFRTRAKARKWRDEIFGYIRNRPDLKAEPHGWRLPQVRKICVKLS